MTTDDNKLVLSKAERAEQLAGNLDLLSSQIQEAWLMEGNFSRTIAYGMAVAEMREALTPGVMQSIMKLKGSKLGFRTDENAQNVYPADLVRDCVIDAVTLGLQCVGNQFNIIGGNMYVTKEGFSYLLRKLSAEGKLREMKFIYHPAEITESSTQGKRKDGSPYQKIEREGKVQVDVSCVWNGKPVAEQLEFIVRVNAGMSQDAVLGKAERKAKAWLYNYLTDQSIGDGSADADELLWRDKESEVPVMRDVTPKKEGLRVQAAGVVPGVQAESRADVLPGLEGSVEEAEEAALAHLSKALAAKKRRLGDVIMWCRHNGVRCPEMGAARAEVAKFAGWLMGQRELLAKLADEFGVELS